MSLLITKSPAGKPNSYQNHFKETFEIKPHSQIAVQEVTLHRLNLFTIGADSSFQIYHGTALTALGTLDFAYEVPVLEGTYGYDSLAQHIQSQLNLYEFHPVYAGNWTCSYTTDPHTKEFNGFQLAVSQTNSQSTALIPDTAEIHVVDMDYSAFNGRCTASKDGGLIWFDKALLATEGTLVVDASDIINDASGTLDIGLGRDYDYNADSSKWIDYNVEVDVNGNLIVYNGWSVNSSTGPHVYRVAAEVQYWEDDDSDLSALTKNYDWHSSTYTHIKFLLENQKLSIYVGSSVSQTTLVTDKLKPVSIGAYALYPSILLGQEDDFVEIKGMTFSATHTRSGRALKVTKFPSAVPALHADTNIKNLPRVFGGGTSTSYRGTRSGDKSLDNSDILVVSKEKQPYHYSQNTSNMGPELGFNRAVISADTDGGTSTFKSAVLPKKVPDEPMFVRTTGFTFESLNGTAGVEGPSRILQPLSRFMGNKTSGMLKFVPPERTYLDLHNPNKLVLHSISVEIVNADETLVQDLSDTTCVVFHIR